jgi:hypothetical protein
MRYNPCMRRVSASGPWAGFRGREPTEKAGKRRKTIHLERRDLRIHVINVFAIFLSGRAAPDPWSPGDSLVAYRA